MAMISINVHCHLRCWSKKKRQDYIQFCFMCNAANQLNWTMYPNIRISFLFEMWWLILVTETYDEESSRNILVTVFVMLICTCIIEKGCRQTREKIKTSLDSRKVIIIISFIASLCLITISSEETSSVENKTHMNITPPTVYKTGYSLLFGPLHIMHCCCYHDNDHDAI